MDQRVPLMAGNWKMHFTVGESVDLAKSLAAGLEPRDDREVAVAPVFTALFSVGQALKGSPVRLSAQNVHFEPQGAYTGEISAPMLKDLGCTYCIVGHSERRQYFQETDGLVSKKAHALIRAGIRPIVCIGETLKEREEGLTFQVVESQLRGSLALVGEEEFAGVVIAYEPVWAIGTGKTATEDQAQEVHGHIRALLENIYNFTLASHVRILYGGSVKPENVSGLMSQKDIDGALVGGASLKAESFLKIAAFDI